VQPGKHVDRERKQLGAVDDDVSQVLAALEF
jgi:hypothetical protein